MTSLNITSVTLAGRSFNAKADSDLVLPLGSKKTTYDVMGSGYVKPVTGRELQTVEGLTLDIDNERDDMVFLSALDKLDSFNVIIVYDDGKQYSFKGGFNESLKIKTGEGSFAPTITMLNEPNV